MPTWMIDVSAREGKLVLPTSPATSEDTRFRKVTADTLTAAIDRASFESVAIAKLKKVREGEAAIMSDKELDWLIDQDLYPLDIVSIPNPQRMGVWDVYLVANKSHAAVQAYAAKINAEYEARPEIKAYRALLAA